MDHHDFTRAATEPAHRPLLLAELRADPTLRQQARAELQRLADGQAGPGMLMDRCHISRMKHDVLRNLLAQADAEATPPVTVTE